MNYIHLDVEKFDLLQWNIAQEITNDQTKVYNSNKFIEEHKKKSF